MPMPFAALTRLLAPTAALLAGGILGAVPGIQFTNLDPEPLEVSIVQLEQDEDSEDVLAGADEAAAARTPQHRTWRKAGNSAIGFFLRDPAWGSTWTGGETGRGPWPEA